MRVLCSIRLVLFAFFITIILNPAPPLSAQNETIAVLDFEAKGISVIESSVLADRLEAELVISEQLIVVERGKMRSILEEQNFQLSGCTSNECAVEIGQLLGVSRMVSGSVGKIGSTYSMNIRAIDVTTGVIVKYVVKDYRGEIDGLLGLMPVVAKELFAIDDDEDYFRLTPAAEAGDDSRIVAQSRSSSSPSDSVSFNSISIDDLQSTVVGENIYHIKYLLSNYTWESGSVAGIDALNTNRIQVSIGHKKKMTDRDRILKQMPWLIPFNDGFGEYRLSAGDYVICYSLSDSKMYKGVILRTSSPRMVRVLCEYDYKGLIRNKTITCSIEAIALIKIQNR